MNECKKTGSSNPGFFRSPQKIGHPAWDGSDQTYPFILSAGVINRKNKACQGKINGKNHEKNERPGINARHAHARSCGKLNPL
jgi:hypothetical protein